MLRVNTTTSERVAKRIEENHNNEYTVRIYKDGDKYIAFTKTMNGFSTSGCFGKIIAVAKTLKDLVLEKQVCNDEFYIVGRDL